MGTVDLSVFGIAEMNMPEMTGKFSGRLLIVASGRCAWDDVKPWAAGHDLGYEKIKFDGDIMCVNDIGMHFPGRVRHWYSNDAHMLPCWLSARRPEYATHLDKKLPIITHTCAPAGVSKTGAEVVWPWPGHGGSGLNAVYTGLGLGYDEILVAGMPLDNTGHYFDPAWVETRFSTQVPPQKDCPENRWWKNARLHLFEGRVKALSGRPREWLR